jgi:hypothetical protein
MTGALTHLDSQKLQREWDDLAVLLVAKRHPVTGKLPPTYAARYERVRAEFARRGVQLSIFP